VQSLEIDVFVQCYALIVVHATIGLDTMHYIQLQCNTSKVIVTRVHSASFRMQRLMPVHTADKDKTRLSSLVRVGGVN